MFNFAPKKKILIKLVKEGTVKVSHTKMKARVKKKKKKEHPIGSGTLNIKAKHRSKQIQRLIKVTLFLSLFINSMHVCTNNKSSTRKRKMKKVKRTNEKKNEDFEGLPVMGILRNMKRGRFFRGA